MQSSATAAAVAASKVALESARTAEIQTIHSVIATLRQYNASQVGPEVVAALHPRTCESLRRTRQCATCGTNYTEARTIGQHQCRHHPDTWDPLSCRWLCCDGVGKAAPKCRNIDHADLDVPPTEYYVVPRFLIHGGIVAQPPPTSVVASADRTLLASRSRVLISDADVPEAAAVAYWAELRKGAVVVRAQGAVRSRAPLDPRLQ